MRIRLTMVTTPSTISDPAPLTSWRSEPGTAMAGLNSQNSTHSSHSQVTKSKQGFIFPEIFHIICTLHIVGMVRLGPNHQNHFRTWLAKIQWKYCELKTRVDVPWLLRSNYRSIHIIDLLIIEIIIGIQRNVSNRNIGYWKLFY